MTATLVTDPVIDELVQICGTDHVFADRSARVNRARVPAPFPVHRWADHIPDVVVLPTSAEQIAEVVKLANRHRIPVVPRAGGTGLTDGAVPLRHGILVDVKLMNKILEIDLEDRTVTVQPGINMLKLNEELRPHGVIYPDDPASYPCSLVGGRIGTSGWSLIGGRYGHTRDLVISFQIVLPTGELIRVGDGGGRKVRKSSSGYQLKHLFMGHQGTLGIVTEATLELVPRPETEFAAFFSYPDYETAWRSTAAFARSGLATLAGVVLFDEWKLAYLRRDDEAYIPQPDSVRCVVATAMYGTTDEVRPAAKRLLRIGQESGGNYLGDEISQGDWASRHDRYATPLHGRLRDGQVVPMSWHCEDASINWTALPQVRQEWHDIVARLADRYPDLRRLGDVRLHEWRVQAVGRLPDRDRRRHLGAGARRRVVGGVGRGETGYRRRSARVRRIHQRLPRLVPRRRGRPGAAGNGRRLRGHEEGQACARPQQHHEPGQVLAGPGVRGG